MIVVTVFLSILNQMEFHLVQNHKENCHHDHIPLNVKGNRNIVFSVWLEKLHWSDVQLFERISRHNERLVEGLLDTPRASQRYGIESLPQLLEHHSAMASRPISRTDGAGFCRFPAHTAKTIFPFPFTLNGVWSWWQFSFRLWTKWSSIWFKIERKIVTTIISHSMWKELEI